MPGKQGICRKAQSEEGQEIERRSRIEKIPTKIRIESRNDNKRKGEADEQRNNRGPFLISMRDFFFPFCLFRM